MKTAIILRGHARTWNYIKNNSIKFFDDLYDKPDWYIVFPKTDTVSVESLREDFQNSNLISIQLLNENDWPFSLCNTESVDAGVCFSPSYWKQAWFDYMGCLVKRKYELDTHIRYTNVIGCRPDIYYKTLEPSTDNKIELEPMAISNINWSGLIQFGDWSTPDFIWRAGSAAADIFCMRFLDSYLTDSIPNQFIQKCDLTLPTYYEARNLLDARFNVGHFPNQTITPNMPLPIDPFNNKSSYYKAEWNKLPIQTRIQICIDQKISPVDYQLVKT